MLEELKIRQYRKLENMTLKFNKGINIISGSNGTCKSSLLYIVSNSFQKVTRKNLKRKEVISIISNINKLMNPKIESLTRGDKKYNNPAPSIRGELYSCKYFGNDAELKFRRHNSGKEIKRFSVRPKYTEGRNEKLPAVPIIYLGLFRLFSYGEFQNDEEIREIEAELPEEYSDELRRIYRSFTKLEILSGKDRTFSTVNMGEIKKRGNFSTGTEGIDSNTISAGEDNLYIILTALMSLRYYSEAEKKPSIILIDELDATLHPGYQIRLYEMMKEYSGKYEIQIFFTSHSLSLIEYALKDRESTSVFYFLENPNVKLMENITISKIEMWLKTQLQSDIDKEKKIPVYTEDREAREFLRILFEHFRKSRNITKDVFGYFHLVDIKISSEALKQLFCYDEILRNNISSISTGSICILDGDQGSAVKSGLSNNIMCLPSDKSPEELCFDYSLKLYEEEDRNFWSQGKLEDCGYTLDFFRMNIKKEMDENREELESLKEKNRSRGKSREFNKKLFNRYIFFFRIVLEYWIMNNKKEVDSFYEKLRTLFQKVSVYQKIDSKLWEENKEK